VQEGFQFTEGPVGAADGTLYFTDYRASRIYRLDASGKAVLYREKTNETNGLALNRAGELVLAEGAGRRISVIRGGKVVELTAGSPARPLMVPNDLIVDAKGGIYFTDPASRPIVPGRKVYVYYLPPGAKEPLVIDDELARPNGIAITPDGRTLIVGNIVSDVVQAYDIQPDGSVRNKRTFARLTEIPAGEDSGADGIAVDRDGRVYVTSIPGVQVFDSAGRHLGTIRVPRRPTNVAFAGPGKQTLYITAREGLYRLQMAVPGPDRVGK